MPKTVTEIRDEMHPKVRKFADEAREAGAEHIIMLVGASHDEGDKEVIAHTQAVVGNVDVLAAMLADLFIDHPDLLPLIAARTAARRFQRAVEEVSHN